MEKRKMSSFKVIKRQLKILKEQKKGYIFILALLLVIAGGALPVIAIYLPKIIIDSFGHEDIYLRIIFLTGISLVLAVVIAIVKGIPRAVFLEVRINEFIKSNQKFIDIDYVYMENPKFLDEIERNSRTLNNNHEGFEGTYHHLLNILPLLSSLVAFIIILGSFNYLIVLAIFAGGLVSILVSALTTKYQYRRKDEMNRAYRHMRYFYNVGYDFNYGKDIRLYALEDKLANKYRHKIISYITIIKDIKNRRFFYGLMDLFMLLLQDGLAYFLIIYSFNEGNLTLGDVSLYLAAVIALSTTLREIAKLVGEIREFTMFTADYFSFIDDSKYHSQKGDRLALLETLQIEFKNVCFKYPNTDEYIFENLNFTINQGEKLAIVGTNGAGKTTLIKLITGLFYPTSGQILVNGYDIMEFKQDEYRKMFGVVFQDFHIFAASVLENVIGKSTNAEDINRGKSCLEKVGLKEKIESLPQGYNTQLLKIIDENGIELSGGQNQKIAIARAIYKDANMVILDEPTAALDALAEAEIYQDFDELVRHKTAVYVSHRLSSTKFCDHIAMFSKQGLIEYGTHNELMALKGQYYEMFTIQGKYYQEKEGESNEKFENTI